MGLFFFSIISLFSLSVFADPFVRGVTPNCGSREGGDSVIIRGTGFTGATEVDFGIKVLSPSEFTFVNDTTIAVTTPPSVPGVVQVVVKVGSTQSPPNHPYDNYVYQGDWLAYIPYFNGENTYEVLVFDVELEKLLFSIPAQRGGNDVAILPDGTFAYAVNSGSNSLTIIDCTTNGPIPFNPTYPIPGGIHFPITMAIRNDGKQGLICSYFSNTLSILDLSNPTTPTLVSTLSLASGAHPTSVAYTIDGTTAFITDDATGNLTKIDLTTPTFTSTIVPFPPGSIPSWVVMSPNGQTAYVSSNTLLYPVTNLTGVPIVQPGIPGFNFSYPYFFPELIISADGTLLLATNTGDSTVQPVTLSGMTRGTLIPVGTVPNGISISPDGTYAYVADGTDDTIAIIHPISPPAVVISKTPTTSQTTPTDVAIIPDQAPLAYFTADTSLSGLRATFDASLSQSPTGAIALYSWDFGDGGQIINTDSPFITYQYQKPGTYEVTLTVTNSAGTSTTVTFTGQLVLQNGGPTATTSLAVSIPSIDPIIQTKNKFLTRTCYENLITFTVPTGPNPPAIFYIYGDKALTKLLAVVYAASPSVSLCSSHKHASYYVIIEDSLGNVSNAVEITI